MSARPILLAGAIVAATGTAVLAGWIFDLTAAKSLLSGWRVMVPATAACFVFAGVAAMLAARNSAGAGLIAARITSAAGLALPLLTFFEYLTATRTGIEGWFGVSFDDTSAVAGRMSPLTSLCFVALHTGLIAATVAGRRALIVARIASGATLLTAWLAVLAVAFDTGRLADVPRFPGMAVMTIGLFALSSWSALALSFNRDASIAAIASPRVRIGAMVMAAFAVPLALGMMRDALSPVISAQVMTSLLVLILAATMAAIVWHYGSRMAMLREEREVAFMELERRVTERTFELEARNEALRHSEDRLREADRRKDEFLATLAHELRNPLAPIRNAVAILRYSMATDAERLEAQLIIERQVRQMGRLIDDLLDVSRITAGKLRLQNTRLELSAVLNLAIATVHPHIEEAQHRLAVSLPDGVIYVDGDEARLSQVFANLLHNSCKYTNPGGEIAVTVSLPSESEVEVAVRDNGIGIAPEFLPRLFEKFSQVAPFDHSQGGLGLGLSLVHGIVALHRGRIEARSMGLGHGSEFVVRLPLLAVEPIAVEAPPPIRSAATPPVVCRRVLVVDDNVDSADSLALILRLQGHLVETAHDGEDAIAHCENFQPDAILLDIGMPGLDGYQVCERIRMRPWGRDVLMVAQTGWGQAQDRARTLEAGFDVHLTKPIDPDVIQDLLIKLKPVPL
jgi:signal transduction histidine kinase